MKYLLLSTAICAGIASAAAAQEASPSGMFRPGADPMDVRASDFIGMRVYASEAEIAADNYDGMQQGWDDIGEINDVILTRDGRVDSVLVDIGGFLGMGERQVAVGMDAVRFVGDGSTADNSDDFFLVINAARTDLESAPDYLTGEMPAAAATKTDTTAEATTETGTATTTEAAGDTPMAEGTVDVQRNPITRDGYMLAEPDFLTSEKLTGARVYDANDDWIGDISNLVLSDDGQVTDVVVDVGGFLGMGEKPVALGLTQIDILRSEAGDEVRVYLSMTKDELDAMARFEG